MVTKADAPPARTALRRTGGWRPGSHRPVGTGRRETWLAVAFVVPAVLLVAALMYYPMLRAVYDSLFATLGFGGLRRFVGLERYADMLGSGMFWRVVVNSVVWTGGVVLAQNVVGMAVAVLLNQRLPLRRITRSVVLIPWVLPGIVAALLWRFLYDPQLGLVNGLLQAAGITERGVAWLANPSTAMLAVIVAAVWKGFPFSTVIYLAGLQTVDQQQLEAARVDGAGPWQRFRHVVLPNLAGIIRLNLLLTTLFTFNYFDMIWVTTQGGPLGATHTFPTYIFEVGFGQFRFGEAAAYGVAAAVLLSLFAALYVREMRPGRRGR